MILVQCSLLNVLCCFCYSLLDVVFCSMLLLLFLVWHCFCYSLFNVACWVLMVQFSLFNVVIVLIVPCLMLLAWCSLWTLLLLLLILVQCYLFGAPCSMLLVDVIIAMITPCLMLLLLLLLLVWRCCSSCYSLLDSVPPLTAPLVVPYSTLLLHLLFFAWHYCFSICLSWTQLVKVSFCYTMMLMPLAPYFVLNIVAPILPILD